MATFLENSYSLVCNWRWRGSSRVLTKGNRYTRTMPPTFPLRMSSSKLWRRATMSRRSRPWYACHCGCPALSSWPSDNLVEEDPLHNAQWRPANRPPHAHYSIRNAEQVEAPQEAHVLLFRSLPEARCAREATAGVDSGLVGHYHTTRWERQG
jgi:hypothetical protein